MGLFLIVTLLIGDLRNFYRQLERKVEESSTELSKEVIERKQAKGQLSLLANALASSSELICITDNDNRFIYANEAFLNTYGYREEEVLGKNPDFLRATGDLPPSTQEIFQLTALGGSRGELLNRRKNGSEFPIYLSTSLVKNEQGRIVGLVGVARDITEQKKAEHALRESEAQFENLFAEFSPVVTQYSSVQPPLSPVVPSVKIPDFAERIKAVSASIRSRAQQTLTYSSLASHELRIPLAILRNQLENILRPNVPHEELMRSISSVYDDVVRMSHIVDKFLELSKMLAGTFQLDLQDVNFSTYTKEFYEDAHLICRGQDITFVLARCPDVVVALDKIRFREVLFNLLDNAIKHTPPKGRIHLRHKLEDNNLVVQLSDNGTGISIDRLPNIFKLFHDPGVSEQDMGGIGLGLALVKWIVEAHQGSITVESELNKGTTFEIRLPLSDCPTRT